MGQASPQDNGCLILLFQKNDKVDGTKNDDQTIFF